MYNFATPCTAANQAYLTITNSRNLFKLRSIESVMPSNHLILCHPLLLLPSIFSSIRVFSNELVLRIRWPKHWSFSNIQDWFPLGLTGWISLQSKGLSTVCLKGLCPSAWLLNWSVFCSAHKEIIRPCPSVNGCKKEEINTSLPGVVLQD